MVNQALENNFSIYYNYRKIDKLDIEEEIR